jgi:SAM domain (Sterile alpha motif)
MDIGGWLRGLGLEQYWPAFRENDINDEVLLRLMAEDLRELGVASIGHRRVLLDAIAAPRLRCALDLSANSSEFRSDGAARSDS